MKILNIYFKNINSLEGETRIHFDQAPIANTGVFAIIGPNGSGKSSILDAITLGLYGETFRFDRPAKHVMTKLTAESFSQVEFSLGNDTFRSSWQVSRENGEISGQLLDAEMTLVQLNNKGQIIEDNAQNVVNKITELTGMDFHRFSQSMVLAQGDFSAFLNALDSERMDILEKINGTDIYAEYQQKAEQKNTQAHANLQQLKHDISAIPVMDESTIDAYQEDLADFQLQQTDFTEQQQTIQQQLTWVTTITDLNNQIETLTEQQQQLINQSTETQENLKRIETSQDVIQFNSELSVVESKADEVQRNQQILDNYRNESNALEGQLKLAGFDQNTVSPEQTPVQHKQQIDKLKLRLSELNFNLPREKALLESSYQQIEEKKSVLNSTQIWLQEHTVDKSLLTQFPETTKLRELKTELTELTEKQKAYKKWAKKITAELSKQQSNSQSLNKKSNDLNAQKLTNEKALKIIAEGRALQEIQDLQVEQQERVNNFQELYALAQVNVKVGKKGFFEKFLDSHKTLTKEQQLKDEKVRLQLEIRKEQNIEETLKFVVNNERLIKKFQPNRKDLVDGKPCPLCGALDHPYLHHEPVKIDSKKAFLDQRKKVSALTTESGNIEKQIIVAQKQTEKEKEKDSKLQVVYSQWMSLANKLNVASEDLDIDDPTSMKNLLKIEKQELSNITALSKEYTSLETAISQGTTAIEANDLLLTSLTEKIAQLKSEWNSRPDELTNLEQAYTQCQAQEQTLTESIVKQLTDLGEKMPSKNKENVLLNRLNTKKQDYQLRVTREQELIAEIQSAEQQINRCNTKITEINQNLQSCSEQIQQQEKVGVHLSFIEKQKLIVDKKMLITQQLNELDDLKNTLLNKVKATGTNDLNVLRETIILVQQQSEIQQKQQQLVQNTETMTQKLSHLNDQLDIEKARQLTDKYAEELIAEQQLMTEKRTITEQEISRLQSELNKQDDLQEKYQQMMSDLTAQKSVVETSDADIKLITDDNGLHFRHQVQQIMVDKLLSHTNQVLEKISARYYLRQVNSEYGLALEIEDTKQQNIRRLPKTLSGGESFVVSLALALGLAEMASNGYHALDSLFLDEGFGSLDSESLYLALTTLESLKKQGKTVGIISHVDGVRKRIKTQIRMIKKPNGFSRVKKIA